MTGRGERIGKEGIVEPVKRSDSVKVKARGGAGQVSMGNNHKNYRVGLHVTERDHSHNISLIFFYDEVLC